MMRYVWLAFAVGMAVFGLFAMVLGVAVLVILPSAEVSFVEAALYTLSAVTLVMIGFALILLSYEFLYREYVLEKY